MISAMSSHSLLIRSPMEKIVGRLWRGGQGKAFLFKKSILGKSDLLKKIDAYLVNK